MNDQGEKHKVLLIEDEADILGFFKGVFKNFKHINFFTAMNGRTGIDIAKQEKPQVILLDLRMPGISGEDILKELKPILPETKFIVMTGWQDGQTKERIVSEYGVEAYYEKPIDLEKVISRVLALIMVKP